MQQHHAAKVRLLTFHDATHGERMLMAARDAQLDQAPQPDRSQEQRVPSGAHTHRNNTSSILSPGPNPAARPYAPVASRCFVSHSRNTKKIVALDRLP